VSNPRYGRIALQALYESNGAAETATDEEMISAVKLLGKEGIFSEPAGAAPIAAAIKLVEDGQISSDQEVVCIVTGHGLKNLEILTTISERPLAIEPRLEEIEKTLRNQ
jgi:threonine synthase